MDGQSMLLEILGTIITVVVAIVSKYVVSYLNAKKEETLNSSKEQVIINMESRALDIVRTVVDTVSQTYVNSLKTQGKFDKEAQEVALGMAKSEIDKIMSTELKEYLEASYNDIDTWVRNQIEAHILETKK